MAVSKRLVEYSTSQKYVRIEISVSCEDLVGSEADSLASTLADDAMRSMNQAKYLHAPLSKVKAKRLR